MATLLSAASSTGSGQSHTGPCTVYVHNDSVFDGAIIVLEAMDADTVAKYAPVRSLSRDQDNPAAVQIRQSGVFNVNLRGTYFLRAAVAGGGASTSLNVSTTQ